MKKLILVTFIAAIIVSSVCAKEIKGKKFVYEVGDESASITSYIGEDEKVSIPKTVNKIPVTKIGNRAFYGNEKIKTLVLNSNITEIGEEAFYGCINLRLISIKGKSEQYILGKNCFADCPKLKVKFINEETVPDNSPKTETTEASVESSRYAGAPERENMVYVEGNENVNSFFMGKYEFDGSIYNKYKSKWDSYLDSDFPVSTTFSNICRMCNLMSISESRTPCYSFDESTNPDDWHCNFDQEKWTDDEGMIHKIKEGFKCNFDADGYRLPSVEEWLYAARGGKNPDLYRYSGSDDIDEVAINSNIAKRPQKSGKLKPNKLGLYDMSGNYSEMCIKEIKDGVPIIVKCGGDFAYSGNKEYETTFFSIDDSFKEQDAYLNCNYGARIVCTAK